MGGSLFPQVCIRRQSLGTIVHKELRVFWKGGNGDLSFFISDSKLGRQFGVDQERTVSSLENKVTLRMSD